MREVRAGADCGESGVSGCRNAGRGPGEQKGMCLLGTAAGVPRWEVLMLRWGGGVAVRLGTVAARVVQTAVAITLVEKGVAGSEWCPGWHNESLQPGYSVYTQSHELGRREKLL